MNSRNLSTTALLSVYDGRLCIGFVLPRGKLGFEAFDRNMLSKGLFATQQAAAAALSEDRAVARERTS
jgi:hypothetical protein